MGRYSKAIYLKHNLQALSWHKMCAIGVGRRLARNSGAMGVEIIYFVNVLSDRGNPYRVTSVLLKYSKFSSVRTHGVPRAWLEVSGGGIPEAGIPEVGNRWEFPGNSLLKNGVFREFPGIPIQGGFNIYRDGLVTSRYHVLLHHSSRHYGTSHHFCKVCAIAMDLTMDAEDAELVV